MGSSRSDAVSGWRPIWGPCRAGARSACRAGWVGPQIGRSRAAQAEPSASEVQPETREPPGAEIDAAAWSALTLVEC